MKRLTLLILSLALLTSMSADLPAYKIFNKKDKETDFSKLLKEASEADVIFFGEQHNNPINHWLQFELTKALYAEKGKRLVLGAEMFESDNALLLNEYLSGAITEKSFESEAKLWPNYKTDYKPLVSFARDSSLRFIATNIPRRYASIVNRNGFEGLDSLDAAAKTYIAPLPVAYDAELPGYKSMIEMMGGQGGHVNENLPKAQAVKDATMAYFINKNLNPGETFLHFNGTYHSDNFEGIVWYLKNLNPNLKILTISAVEQKNIDKPEEENSSKADFIIITPETMTKTN
ncbi:MAG: ChaN family lipoprotein [Lentimicrobiaceae bacterium]|nr:ChaN family lipoprotein [Lentimicrobiaceae bacterium]MCB9023130.1 ChaN family lipoprotein [Lentimicrobiaceae bacterium]